jgi:hypothetical protein
MTGSAHLDNPFLLPDCPVNPADPEFRSFVLDPHFDAWWRRRERGWSEFSIPVDRNSYVDLFIRFMGCCGICGRFWRVTGKLLAVDHSHLPGGGIRGLCCPSCNYDLGKVEQRVSCGSRYGFTRAQAAYLRRSPAGLELLALYSVR